MDKKEQMDEIENYMGMNVRNIYKVIPTVIYNDVLLMVDNESQSMGESTPSSQVKGDDSS